jgi:hypothetical protein
MRIARPVQAARSVAGWRHALRSGAHGAGAAAAGITAYVCGLATVALIGALLLAVAPPDLSGIIDSIDKTIAYADAPGRRPEPPDITGSVAAPDTVTRRSATPATACTGPLQPAAQDDSPCAMPPARRDGAGPGGPPSLRGHL